MLRTSSLDDFIDHLKETYERLPPEAWQAFKDQVEAIGKSYGEVTLQYVYDVENNTITVSIADIQSRRRSDIPRQRN
jgi:hypothetical protein